MKIAVTLAADSDTLTGLGRAPRIAVAETASGEIVSWNVQTVAWDIAHDQGPEGSHHARIVTFMRELGIEAVLAAHVGPGMVAVLDKMGLAILQPSTNDARQALLDAAKG